MKNSLSLEPDDTGHAILRFKGTLLIRKRPPPYDHHRSLGIGLLWSPTGGLFLMSEVPLGLQVSIE